MSIFHESIKIKLNVKLKSLTICIAFDLCIRLFHHVYAREGGVIIILIVMEIHFATSAIKLGGNRGAGIRAPL